MDSIMELFENFDIVGAFLRNLDLTWKAAVGSLILGTLLAIMRVSPIPSLQLVGTAYVNIVRNTPLTLIVLFSFRLLSVQLGVDLFMDPDSPTYVVDSGIRFAIFALAIYHAAFVCEALRSGVNTVPLGQAEAARSIGLSFGQSLGLILLPQAFRGAIAPLGNVLIALTKNSTIASVLGVAETSLLMKTMQEFRPDIIIYGFLILATGFVLIVVPVGYAMTYLSNRLAVKR